MATVVYRVYGTGTTDMNDLEDYVFSIIATDTGAEYVFPEGTEPVEGLDSERIDINVIRLYEDNEKPQTATDWADVAAYRIFGSVFSVDQEFDSVESAKESESAFAKEAKGFVEDAKSLQEEDDSLLVDDEDEEETE
jgi:hypothetical protein